MFIIAVFLLLLAVSLCFPEDGIIITKGLRIRFFSTSALIPKNDVSYADIGEILRMQELLNDSIIREYAVDIQPSDTVRADRDQLIASITKIEYPNDDHTILYSFFSQLRHAGTSTEPLRILHYGDSQIEDDRITSYLRYRLQSRFGGSGVGLVPVAQLYPYSFSMMQTNSDNWFRYVVCGRTDSTLTHDRYGALGSFGMFTPPADALNTSLPESPVNGPGEEIRVTTSAKAIETSGAAMALKTAISPESAPDVLQDEGSRETTEAWVEFSPSRYSYENTRNFTQCRIYYGYNIHPFLVELYLGDSLYDADLLPATGSLRTLKWDFGMAEEDLTLRFSGTASPEIYGISLDGNAGIAVDNIALRGCSGPFLTRMDTDLLADMYGELNVGLFILQFGGNMVPAEVRNFNGYENWFVNQISLIRETCPAAAILIIGVADMSIRENSRFITNPNVEKVRTALKNAAKRTGAAYWDMYSAMGGRNSMPSWVNANPSLAAGDYVHFNPLGAKTIAQMFYNALMLEYQQFEKDAQR